MAHQIVMPKASMSMEEGTIIQWFKEIGDEVETGEPLLEIETDKVTMDVEAENSGILLKIVFQEGDSAKVAEVIGYIGEEGEQVDEETVLPVELSEEAEEAVPMQETIDTPSTVKEEGKIAATPKARTLASQHHVDLAEISGSGPNGEILGRDIPIHEHERREKMSSMRRAIARNMTESYQQVPQVTLHMNVDVTDLLLMRTSLKSSTGNRFSINDFVTAAAAAALAESPNITVSVDREEIIYKDKVHIGVATAVENGLLVPVIQDADTLSLEELSSTITKLTQQARSGSISPKQLTGGTFTISNLGMYGIMSFNPIINPPESAILGVCAVYDVLRQNGNSIETRKQLGLSLTIDHRVIDGAGGSKFLQKVTSLLEDPARLLR